MNFLRWPFKEDYSFSVIAFLVLFVPLVFSLKTYENFEIIKFSLFLLCVGLAVLTYFFGRDVKRENKSLPIYWVGALIILFIFALVSAILAPNHLAAVVGFYPRMTNGLVFYAAWIILVWLIFKTFTQEKFHFLLKLIVLDALLISVYGLLESVGIGLYYGEGTQSLVRAPSFLGNPNLSGMFLAISFPLVLGFLFQAKTLGSRVYYSLVALISLWATAVFSSRGAFLGLIVASLTLGICLLYKKNLRRHFVFLPIVLLVGAMLTYALLGVVRPNFLKQTFSSTDTNINLRFYAWDVARKAIIDHPLTGVGLGSFVDYYESARDKHLADQKDVFDDPHNLFLFQAATGGVIFALAFWSLFFFAIYSLFKKFIRTHDAWGPSLIAGLLAWAVTSSFTPVPVTAFVILAVLLVGGITESRQSLTAKRTWILKLVFSAAAFGFIIFSLAFVTSEHLFFVGYQAYFNNQEAKALKYTALSLKVCPCNPITNLYYMGSSIKTGVPPEEISDRLADLTNPDSIRSLLRMGNLSFLLYQKTGNIKYADIAILDLKQALAMNPNNSDRYIRLAFMETEIGRSQEALENVDAGLSLKMDIPSGWMLKAKLHQIMGQKQPMLNSLIRVQSQYPNDANLARLIAEAKKTEDIKSLPLNIGANYDRLE